MKVREVMSKDPIYCVPSDKAQNVAKILRDRNVGSLPVVTDPQAHKLVVTRQLHDYGQYSFTTCFTTWNLFCDRIRFAGRSG